MKRTLKRFLGTVAALVLVASMLAACGQGADYTNQPPAISVGRCSKQFWTVMKGMSGVQSSSRSVYFVSGVHLYALNAGNGALRWCMSAAYASTHLSTFGNTASLLQMGPPPLPDGFSALTVSNGIVYACSMNGYTYAFDSGSGELLWKHNTSFANTSAPTVFDGVVYVGSGNIYALNGRDGSELWKYSTQDVVTSSPVIVNGVLYVGSYGDRVYALSAASGALRWQYNTGGRVYVDPVVAAGTVFFGSGDDVTTLYAVNARDGKLLWHNPMRVESSLAVANGVLYVGSNNSLYALNPQTGSILWSRPLPTQFKPLIVNGIIYASSDSDGMYALNAHDGTLLWRNALNPTSVQETVTPVLMNGELYVATVNVGAGPQKANFHALNASNGIEDWNASVDWNISSIGVAA